MGRRDCIYNSVGALWSFLFPFFCCRKHSVYPVSIDYLGIHVPSYTYLYKYEKEWE